MDDNQKFTFLKYRWLIYSIYLGCTTLVAYDIFFDIREDLFFLSDPLFLVQVLYSILFYKKIMISPANNFLLNPHYKYIKTNNPEIWKEIEPTQFCITILYLPYFIRPIEFLSKWIPFLRGRYDDGKDPHLVNIRRDYTVFFIITHWNFFLFALSILAIPPREISIFAIFF